MKMLNFGIPFNSKTNQNKKNMKKIFRFAAMVAAAAALFSCQEPVTPDPGTGDENQGTGNTELNVDIKFTLTVSEVESDQAKVKVEHDGERTDTWYGFVTTASDIDQAIDDEVAALVASGKVSLQKSTSKTVTVRDLEAETAYTYVVFGLSDQGQVYGEPASVEFTTAKAPVVIEGYQVNPAWTITYIGQYEEQGQVYDNVVSVETTDQNTYFVTAWPKAAFDEMGIEYVAETECASWLEYLAGTNYTFADLLYNKSILTQVEIDTQYGTEWYAIVIGADAEGNPTGLYAMTDLITIVEEEMTEEYADWLGTWTVTGTNGVAWDVTFSKGIANQTYKLSGWEGPESEGLDVTVDWMAEDGIWVVFAQSLGVYDFGSYGQGAVWIVPQDTEGYIYPSEGVPACLGGYTEDGQRLVIGYSEELEDGSVVEMATMMYLADLGKWYTITSTEAWPTFPLTVEAATKATTCSVSEFKGSKKTLKAAGEFKAYSPKTPFMVR